MIYGFDTTDEHAAAGALLLYAVWRSRDRRRFKVTPDLWGQIERFTKASAKRTTTLPGFLDALKPRLLCATLHPRWLMVGDKGQSALVVERDAETGAVRAIIDYGGDRREFATSVINRADARATLALLLRETAWIVLLVRDRLEREKPIEDRIESDDEEIAA